jgi:hypothetical protein
MLHPIDHSQKTLDYTINSQTNLTRETQTEAKGENLFNTIENIDQHQRNYNPPYTRLASQTKFLSTRKRLSQHEIICEKPRKRYDSQRAQTRCTKRLSIRNSETS